MSISAIVGYEHPGAPTDATVKSTGIANPQHWIDLKAANDEITRLRQALLDANAGRQHAVDVADAATERIKALEGALRPFAEFHPSLLEWRTGVSPWLLKDAFPDHSPVLVRTYPLNYQKDRVCRIYVRDFERAAALLEKS